MSSIYSKAERYKKVIKYMFEKYKPKCPFCKRELDWKTYFRNMNGKQLDDNTEHHLNGDHFDDRIENRELSHRKCHLSYHRQLEEKQRQDNMNKILNETRGVLYLAGV